MKFTTYNQQVNAPSGGGATLQISSDPNAYGGNGAGFAAMAKGFDAMAAGVEAHNENEDKTTLMAFMSDLEKARYEKLHNQENGYLNRMNDGAIGISESYQKDMKQTTDDLMEQYKFKTDRYKLAAKDLSAKSNLQGYEQVSNWENKQKQAFEMVKLNEFIDTASNNASASPAELSKQLDNVSLMASMVASPEKYGTEGSKLFVKEAQGKVISNTVNTLINNEDYIGAGNIIQGFGDKLDYKTRASFEKILNNRLKANIQLQTFDDLYSRYGNNVEAAVAALTQNTDANITAGMDYARKALGTERGSNQCANFTSDVIKAMGGDTSLVSPIADGMYRIAEEKGLTFTDRNKLKDGDVVYWQVNGSKYAYSNDPNATQGNDSAYKGITHVGVYDAKTGKVIQSGESGVKAIDLDAYNVVGFSRVTGRQMDEVERQKRANEYRTFANAKIAQHKQQMNYYAENAANTMLSMFENNVLDPQAYIKIAKDTANGDERVYSHLIGVAKSFGVVAANGTNGKALSYDEKGKLFNIMQNGKAFDGDYAKGLAFVTENWKGNPAAVKAYNELYKQQRELSGPFKYNMSGIVNAAVGKVPEGATGLSIKRAAETAAINYVFDYRNTHEGKDPSTTDVINHVQDGMKAINWGNYTYNPEAWIGKTKPLMLAPNDVERAGIRLIEQSSVGDTFKVFFRDGHVESMTGDMVNDRVERSK